MLKKIAQRIAFGRESFDPVSYWSGRASNPHTMSVMWANFTYNSLVDRDEWDVIAEHFPSRRGTVLDLGCGTGRMSARLASAFDEYTGVDVDAMVEEARRRNPTLAGRFLGATVDSYEFPEERFDFLVSLACSRTPARRTGSRPSPRASRAR